MLVPALEALSFVAVYILNSRCHFWEIITQLPEKMNTDRCLLLVHLYRWACAYHFPTVFINVCAAQQVTKTKRCTSNPKRYQSIRTPVIATPALALQMFENSDHGRRTGREDWDGEWVMELDGAKEQRIKVRKREDSRQKLLQWMELHADLCGVVGMIVHQPEWIWRLEQRDTCGLVCVYPHKYSGTLLFSLHMLLISSPKQTDFWVWENTLACGEATPTHIHSPLFWSLSTLCCCLRGERALDHPELGSQSSALMWHQHMCSAWVQSPLKRTRKTQFYCLLCGINTPHHWSGGMLKKTKTNSER